jgi:hypothetical protein
MRYKGKKRPERRDNMKKIWILALAGFLCASMAFGDEVDEGLPNRTARQIRSSTRQMIRAGVDKDEAIRMTRLMLENHFRKEEVLRAHEIIMRAKREGLPEGPIMSKAFEGMTKHVEARNVVRAMETVRSRYGLADEHAKRITEERAEREQIRNTIANCFTAGMRDEDTKVIVQALRQRTRTQKMTRAQVGRLATEAFGAARDMARLGASSQAAADVVCQALEHHYNAREMKTMSKSFMARSRYSSPNTLAESYSRAIRGGKSAEGLGASGMGGAGGSGVSGHGGGSGYGGDGGSSGDAGGGSGGGGGGH